MFGRLSITKKVLLLVAVPLALNTGFLGTLALVLNQVELERKAEAHAADLSSALNQFLRMSMEGLLASVLYYFSREDYMWKRNRDLTTALRTQMDVVNGIAEGHPEEMAVLADMKEISKQMEHHGSQARQYLRDKDKMHAVEEWVLLKSDFREMNELVTRVVNEQTTVYEQRRHAVETLRTYTQILLTLGVLLNVGIAFGMVLAFNRSLLSRLRILSDNTLRVAAGRALHPEVSGHDEIAHLDQFFRQMVRSLEEAREKEKEIEQLKRDFVAMVSHDLRTPLASIQMFHSALLEGVYGDISKRGRENLELIETEVDRLIRMVNDLLNIEKLESGNMEIEVASVSVNAMLKRSADAVIHLANAKDVKLVVNRVPNDLEVGIDEERLVQVMINLLGNAIKFAEPESAIEITPSTQPGAVMIEVSDRNRTIPAELRETIFDRFKQVDRSDSRNNKGTGLGLAICKAIVERHGGTIGLRQREGGGNTFWFTVPLAGDNVAGGEQLAAQKTQV